MIELCRWVLVDRVIRAYGQQSGRTMAEKQRFYDELAVNGICEVMLKWFQAWEILTTGRKTD